MLVLRGKGLSGRLSETDPQAVGQPPLAVHAHTPEARGHRRDRQPFRRAGEAASPPTRLRRTCSSSAASTSDRLLPRFPEVVRSAVGGDRGVPDVPGPRPPRGDGRPQDRLPLSPTRYGDAEGPLGAPTTSCSSTTRTRTKLGEDGDFPGKVAALERLDAALPAIEALQPDVLVVSGDHATPAVPPRPLLAPGAGGARQSVRTARCRGALFRAGLRGGKPGDLPAHDLMPLILAHALRLAKYGA